jgi:hypothetical protein
MQRPYDDKGKRRPKAKCELCDCNKQTSSFLAITPVLVRLGRRCCVTGESMSGILQRLKLMRWSSLKHHRMWSVGFKEKALRRQREGHLDGRQRRFHERPLEGKCLTKIKAKACSSKGTVVRRKSINISTSNNRCHGEGGTSHFKSITKVASSP